MTEAHKKDNTDQPSDDVKAPEESGVKVSSEKKPTSKRSGKHRWNRKLFLIPVWGAFVFIALLTYPFLKSSKVSPVTPSVSRRVSPVKPKVKRFPVQNNRSVTLDSFIIPFEDHGRFTYISLSISFELPNKELMNEMTQKNTLIRGIIYNLLNKNMKILTDVSSLEKLKELIAESVNNVLTAGKVNEPIITDFSAV